MARETAKIEPLDVYRDMVEKRKTHPTYDEILRNFETYVEKIVAKQVQAK